MKMITFLNVELPDSLPRFEFVRDIYIENEQNYWLSSINGIYNLRNKGTQTYDFEYSYYPKQNFSNEFSRVTAIQPKDEHNLWLGSDEGLFEFNKRTHTYTKSIPSDTTVANALQNEIWTMHTDQNENLWIATLSKLIYWEKGSEQPQYISTLGNSTFNLRGQPIQSITENEEGKLFFGVSGNIGALIYDPSSSETTIFEHINGDPNSIPENDGHYFFQDVDKNLWFGYHTYGMSLAFDQSWRYEINKIRDDSTSGLPEHDIHKIIENESGDIWFATHLGLQFKTHNSDEFVGYLPVPNDPTNVENQFFDILTDGKKILSYTHSGSFYLFDIESKDYQKLEIDYQTPPFNSKQYIGDDFYIGTISNNIIRINTST